MVYKIPKKWPYAFAFLLVSVILLFIGPNTCQHVWQDATCTSPRTCSSCGKTDGSPLGHDWQNATCTSPRTCSSCGITDGVPPGHDWRDATCTSPRTCSSCGITDGVPLGHDWRDATCTSPKTCRSCGDKEGDALGHVWVPPTFDTPLLCSRCGVQGGDPLSMDMFSRGRHDLWNGYPLASQFVGMTGYVAVAYDSYLYPTTDAPYENDWFSGSWKATTYEKDKQVWNASGTIEHKTPVVVVDQDLVSEHNSGKYRGHLLVERISDGQQFYISVTDFVIQPYWKSSNINDILSAGPCLAVYHQVSDYYPINSKNEKADLKDGAIVLVRGSASGGNGFGDPETNPVDTLSDIGRCYFNASDLTIIY